MDAMDECRDCPDGEVRPGDEQSAENKAPAEAIDFTALPFTREAYDTTCAVLQSLANDDLEEFYNSPQCRPFRSLMQPFFDRQRSKMFAGKTPEEHTSRKQKKIRRAQELEKQRREDKEFLQRTILRAGRIKKLEQVAQQHGDDEIGVPLILDGAVDDGFNDAVTLSAADAQTDTPLVTLQDTPTASAEDSDKVDDVTIKLNSSRGCYICKRRYNVLHHFYDTLCESCASLNWIKRMQTCDLTNRVCLVTGARVKIGFQSALKLLRCGAVVIATSRFPGDTALRYAMQSDYSVWKDRLHVFGVDLRDLAAIEELCAYLNSHFPWLDCIINNACQTIRRPPAYYADVIATERKVAAMCKGSQPPILASGTDRLHSIVEGKPSSNEEEEPSYAANLANHWKYHAACESSARAMQQGSSGRKALAAGDGEQVSSSGTYPSSVDRSAMVMVAEDHSIPAELFPEQKRDVNSQQLDLRRTNSWLLTLSSGDISTPELAEVFAINAMAPFILASKLKPLLIAKRPATNKEPASQNSQGALTAIIGGTAGATAMYHQESLADHVLQTLGGHDDNTDPKRAKRLRDAWKGGGDISGHFTTGGSVPSQAAEDDKGDDSGGNKKKSKTKEAGAVAVPAGECKFIINVSSMEGKFYRRKLATHPHTNMAKAALNMLTRTSAAEYEKHGIYMTAVDTGWINDENPIERAAKTAQKHNFATPLDEIDAAARILDPMLGPLKAAEESQKEGDGRMCSPPFGCFLKDYFPTEW